MKILRVTFCYFSLELCNFIFGNAWLFLEVIIPREGYEVGCLVYACFLDVCHARQHQVVGLPSCGTPKVAVLASVAVCYKPYLPELEFVQKLTARDVTLAYDDLIPVVGCYAFFLFLPFSALPISASFLAMVGGV